MALTTALVGAAGGPDAFAGYGTGARLEYLLIPLVFGLGAPLVALVGTNIGASERVSVAHRLVGGALAFGITETIGLAAAIWPHAWLGLFGDDPRMLEDRHRLPARQRAGCSRVLWPWPVALLCIAKGPPLLWPLLAGRAAPAHRGWWRMGGPDGDGIADVDLRETLGLALIVYGAMLVSAVASGVWFRDERMGMLS